MPTRNVVITDHQAKLIDALVESGEYQNASEVLREGIRLVEERRAAHAAKLEALRAAAREGIASIERGDFVTFSDAKSMSDYFGRITENAIKRRKAR